MYLHRLTYFLVVKSLNNLKQINVKIIKYLFKTLSYEDVISEQCQVPSLETEKVIG
jgi:hypothetical protein